MDRTIWLLFSFSGRVPRRVYWAYLLACIFVGTFPFWSFVSLSPESADTYINVISIVLLWPSIAIQVKRWHDIDKSGVWFFINFVPFIGGIRSLIANGFVAGTEGGNSYGERTMEPKSEPKT